MPRGKRRVETPSKPKVKGNGGVVTFLVGKDCTKIIVHKDFACHYSPVFKAAFNNPRFEEGRTQTYKMEDVEVEVFEMLVNWLYMQSNENGPLVSLDNEKDCDDIVMSLIKLWVLGDKLLIPALQTEVVKVLHISIVTDKVNIITPIPYVYEHTTEGSPLRLLFVYLYAFKLEAENVKRDLEHCPKAMLLDLAQMLIETRKERDKHNVDVEQFLSSQIRVSN